MFLYGGRYLERVCLVVAYEFEVRRYTREERDSEAVGDGFRYAKGRL